MSTPSFRIPALHGSGEGRRRIRLDLAYDGTAYAGWQIQPNRESIQGILEDALARLTGEQRRFHASGRTDAGVHARGQVAHIDLDVAREPHRLALGLNALLPFDIRVLRARHVPETFHARFSATEKEYRYFIWNAPVLDPCLRHYRMHIRRPLELDAMRNAARRLEGRHDFAAFSANPNREIAGTVRTLHELTPRKRGSEIVIIAKGAGFLYKMVRSLAGFLIRIGAGEMNAESTEAILTSRIRTARVPTAPPQGLFLWRVRY